jgi:hypothetical protein
VCDAVAAQEKEILKKNPLLTNKIVTQQDLPNIINKLTSHSGITTLILLIIFHVATGIQIDKNNKYSIDTLTTLTKYYKFTFSKLHINAFKYSKDVQPTIKYLVNLFEIN